MWSRSWKLEVGDFWGLRVESSTPLQFWGLRVESWELNEKLGCGIGVGSSTIFGA